VFRQWEAELGGDICVIDKITLKGKSYLVFANADAMGKSMQGAGGVLVFGTVFRSILNRTHKSLRAQDKYPEQWLKECFLDLQDVFVVFDGSMLISTIIGLIDEKHGFLYFYSAEHPFMVLYRGGKAEFIGSEKVLPKIGNPLRTPFRLVTFLLEKGDVLLVGSDGKDDLLLKDESGKEVMNFDENLFLEIVSKNDAEIPKILNTLQHIAKITDDFSLLKIFYNGYRPAVLKSDKEKLGKIKNLSRQGKLLEAIKALEENRESTGFRGKEILANLYLRAGKYFKAAQIFEECTEERPQKSKNLLMTAYALKKLFDTTTNPKKAMLLKAADFGERCRLRGDYLSESERLLAQIYETLERFKKAKRLPQRLSA